MARLLGWFGLRAMIRDVAAATDMLCGTLPAALRRIGADALICDQMEAAGGLVAEHLGLPFVSVATALPIDREPALPPPYLGWRYDPGGWGLRRNAGGWRVADWLMRPAARVIERHALRFGLPPRRRAEDCLSPTLELAQAVASLDFPRRALPPAFRYLGPFRIAEGRGLELPDDDGRPLAFCSLGTLQGGRKAMFARVAAACASLGLRLVLAHGGRLSPAAARALPGNPLTFDFVPQRALLARCTVAVSHCGFNTVLDAMTFGVPVLALPIAFEQPATASRLVHASAGLALPRWAGERRIRRALAALVGESRFAAAAATAAAHPPAPGGAGGAARLIGNWLSRGAAAPPAGATRARPGRDDARDDSRNGSS
jgi:zeaxanthin glucosyltransferase